jgi:hypothetical protein
MGLPFFPDADREVILMMDSVRSSVWATFVVRASPAYPDIATRAAGSRAGVLGRVTTGAAVLSYGV